MIDEHPEACRMAGDLRILRHLHYNIGKQNHAQRMSSAHRAGSHPH